MSARKARARKVPRHDLFDAELPPPLRVKIPLQDPEGRVGRGGEIFLASDHAPVVAVDGVGFGLQLFDATEGLLVSLTLLEHPVQDLDPASQERTLHGLQVLEKVTELPVFVPIGEQIAIRFASGHELFPRLVRARGRQVPPGLVRGLLHGRQTFFEVGDKALQIGGANHETAPSTAVLENDEP